MLSNSLLVTKKQKKSHHYRGLFSCVTVGRPLCKRCESCSKVVLKWEGFFLPRPPSLLHTQTLVKDIVKVSEKAKQATFS